MDRHNQTKDAMMRKALFFVFCTLFAHAMTSCLENDIPYPLVESDITGFAVEYMCDENGNAGGVANISKSDRKITLYVDDRADMSRLCITSMQVTNDASICVLNPECCVDYQSFPSKSFASLDELSATANTRIDFSRSVMFRLTTYQDYDWTVSVKQVFEQDIQLEGQIGNAIIDNFNSNVIVYVSEQCDLSRIKVYAFTLGGKHGSVVPNPVEYENGYDFSKPVQFYVSRAWEETSKLWTIYVYAKEGAPTTSVSAAAYPMSTRTNLIGSTQTGTMLGVEYKQEGATSWSTLAADAIKVSGKKFTATITGLKPNTSYQYRMLVNCEAGDSQTFTTAGAPQLSGGDFDNWHLDGRVWNPWAVDGTSFWDSGNKGATTVGNSITVPTDETCSGSGQAAFLESKYIVMKFAAGNIFTGTYVKTDGANGVLDFGRPFSGFPTKLRINYKYTCSTINRSADSHYEYLKGRPDTAQIYIALADWNEPYRIRTRPSERHLFTPSDPHVIAYAQISVGHDVPQWTQQELELNYKYLDRTPKYILIVASASKYGDYFTGGDGSKLWVDNFELIYD